MTRAIAVGFLFGLLVACGPTETRDATPEPSAAPAPAASAESAEAEPGTPPGGEPGTSGVTVDLGHNRLSPSEITIAVGGSVTFHNQDEMPGGHTLAADDGSFESPPLAKDESWSRTFPTAGTYPYHIKEHPGAKGKITVR